MKACASSLTHLPGLLNTVGCSANPSEYTRKAQTTIVPFMVVMPHRRGPWSPGEDNFLLQLVQTQGANNWVRISHLIGSRSPKQCRERYHQNLKPTLNHDPITPEEGILIERLVVEIGKRWAEIARRLNGRSDNAVKNWWNGGMNRRRRLVNHRTGPSCHRHVFDERTETPSFARPVNSYPLDRHIRATVVPVPLRRPNEASLPSPSAASEASTTPSLMSDNGSNRSNRSPTMPVSPSIELPPLIRSRLETRRPSLSVPQLSTSNFVQDRENLHPSPIRSSNAEHSDLPKSTSTSPIESQKPLPHFMTITAPAPHQQDNRMSLSLLCS